MSSLRSKLDGLHSLLCFALSEPELASPVLSPLVQRSHSPKVQGLPGGWEGQQVHPPSCLLSQDPSQESSPHLLPPANFSLSPSHSSPQLSSAHAPSAMHAAKTPYGNQMYPSMTGRSHSSTSNRTGEYDNMRGGSVPTGSQDSGFSSANNMYSVHSKHAVHYDSADHLPPPEHASPYPVEDRLNLPSKHGSLEGAYRRGGMPPGYGSLERKRGNSRGGGEAGLREHYSPRHPGAHPATHSGGHALIYSGEHGHGQPHGHFEGHGEGHGGHGGGRPGHVGHLHSGRPPPIPNYAESDYGGGDRGTEGMIEVPVHHDTPSRNLYNERTHWESRPDHQGATRSESPGGDYCYSPRVFEGGGGGRGDTQGHHHHQQQGEGQPSPLSSTLVMVNRLQPHTEVSKPYEMADFYKYSERLRRQRLIDQYQKQLIGGSIERPSRASTPSQHSTDSDSTSHSGSVPSLPLPGPLQGYGRRTESESVPYASREVAHSSSYHAVKGSQSGVQYSVSYKSQQSIATRHVQYQPLQPMTCQPLKDPRPSTPPSGGSLAVENARSPTSMKTSDSFSLDAGESLADAFSEEMLQWYQDREANFTPPTLV